MVEQPYFDDERTVLTARPVIPLQQIDTKVKHRRRWFLGGAFVAAMLLGAAAALLSAYLKIRNAPDAEIQTLSVSPVFPKAPEVPVVEVVPQRPKPQPIRNTDKTDRVVISPPRSEDEDEELRRIRDAVLVDEWQERRQRRVERRERRRAERSGQSGRDLSNLDEIFEGRRRPY